jgi:uncharacterized membrane protein
LFAGYFIAEIVLGIATFILVSGLLSGWGEAGSLIMGAVAAMVVIYLIDRLCVRHTGDSAIDAMPSWP